MRAENKPVWVEMSDILSVDPQLMRAEGGGSAGCEEQPGNPLIKETVLQMGDAPKRYSGYGQVEASRFPIGVKAG